MLIAPAHNQNNYTKYFTWKGKHMKNKIVTLLLLTTLLLTACGNQAPTSSATAESSSTIETTLTETSATETSNSETTNALSELDALGSIEVEKELFDVVLTIPKDYVGDSTQEDLDEICEEHGFQSITLNDDGSATYVMTKSQHKELMEEYRTQINDSLQELVGSENYPNITAIETNDNFTEFTVTTKSTELSLNESFSVMVFYMYGGMYAIFEGTEVDNISVTFVNADSGEVMNTANSSDME